MNRVVYVPQSQLVKIEYTDLSIQELKRSRKFIAKSIAMAENGKLDDAFSKSRDENAKDLFIAACHKNIKTINAELRKRELN